MRAALPSALLSVTLLLQLTYIQCNNGTYALSPPFSSLPGTGSTVLSSNGTTTFALAALVILIALAIIFMFIVLCMRFSLPVYASKLLNADINSQLATPNVSSVSCSPPADPSDESSLPPVRFTCCPQWNYQACCAPCCACHCCQINTFYCYIHPAMRYISLLVHHLNLFVLVICLGLNRWSSSAHHGPAAHYLWVGLWNMRSEGSEVDYACGDAHGSDLTQCLTASIGAAYVLTSLLIAILSSLLAIVFCYVSLCQDILYTPKIWVFSALTCINSCACLLVWSLSSHLILMESYDSGLELNVSWGLMFIPLLLSFVLMIYHRGIVEYSAPPNPYVNEQSKHHNLGANGSVIILPQNKHTLHAGYTHNFPYKSNQTVPYDPNNPNQPNSHNAPNPYYGHPPSSAVRDLTPANLYPLDPRSPMGMGMGAPRSPPHPGQIRSPVRSPPPRPQFVQPSYHANDPIPPPSPLYPPPPIHVSHAIVEPPPPLPSSINHEFTPRDLQLMAQATPSRNSTPRQPKTPNLHQSQSPNPQFTTNNHLKSSPFLSPPPPQFASSSTPTPPRAPASLPPIRNRPPVNMDYIETGLEDTEWLNSNYYARRKASAGASVDGVSGPEGDELARDDGDIESAPASHRPAYAHLTLNIQSPAHVPGHTPMPINNQQQQQQHYQQQPPPSTHQYSRKPPPGPYSQSFDEEV